MGKHYYQLSLDERCSIAQGVAAGQSIQKIAADLDRPASTVSRELSRNAANLARYKAAYAGHQAAARRWRGSKLARQPELREQVLSRLAGGYSPVQVAGRLALERRGKVISHESIYRYIYAELKRSNDGAWRNFLPYAKSKRGRRSHAKRNPVLAIKHRVSIAKRPQAANPRRQPGHWEADLMLFSTNRQNLIAIHERTSRATFFIPQPTKEAKPTARAINAFLKRLPKQLRRTITFDNGTEFALHHTLNAKLGLKTFFCDAHAPWQKGGVENAIGRFRRFMPRNTDIAAIKPKDIIDRAIALNNIPRKCLDFRTPAEVFSKQLLHFKCESTSRLSPG
jgi:transposase, IS30 family